MELKMTKNNDKEYHQEGPFSPIRESAFKKWLSNQRDLSDRDPFVGLEVEAKSPYRRILARMEVQEGELEQVAKDFKKNGGKISEVNGHTMLIEVTSGNFLIHRMHIKRKDDI
jgi:hypothetical protein